MLIACALAFFAACLLAGVDLLPAVGLSTAFLIILIAVSEHPRR